MSLCFMFLNYQGFGRYYHAASADPNTFVAKKRKMKKPAGHLNVRKEGNRNMLPSFKTRLLFSGSILALIVSVSISQASKDFYDRSKSDFAYTLLGKKIFGTKDALINRPASPKTEDSSVSTGRRKAEFVER